MLSLTVNTPSLALIQDICNLISTHNDPASAITTPATRAARTPKKAEEPAKVIEPVPAFLKNAQKPETTFEQVKDITVELASSHPDDPDKGHGVALEVLNKFNVQRASLLKPEQYTDYVAAATAKLQSLKASPSLV